MKKSVVWDRNSGDTMVGPELEVPCEHQLR